MGRIAPLTAQESAFAAEKHDFIFQYLRKRRLPDDYYDVVVEPYIRAVRVWLARPELHIYGFPSIAGMRMDAALYKHRQREARLHQLYRVVRLDAYVGEFQNMAVAEVVADPRQDFTVTIEQREAIREELRKMPAGQAGKLIEFCSASNRRENRQYRKAGEPNPLVLRDPQKSLCPAGAAHRGQVSGRDGGGPQAAGGAAFCGSRRTIQKAERW